MLYKKTFIDLGVVATMFPLEHVLNTGKAGFYATEEFYLVANYSNIYKTTDGVNYTLVAKLDTIFGDTNKIACQFTPSTGVHVCFNSQTKTIEVYAADYATRTEATNYDTTPYPMQGISQNPFTKNNMLCRIPSRHSGNRLYMA